MTAKILEALAKLDPKNDNHWTEDGSPRMDTVKLMSGDQHLTREQLTAAAPGFSRATVLEAAKPTPTPPVATVEGAGDVSSDPGAEGAGVQAKSEAEDELNQALAAAEARMVEAAARKAEAGTAHAQAVAEVDRLIEAREKQFGTTSLPETLSGYFAEQQRQRDARAEFKQSMKGIDLKALIPQKAPIDQAMARKTARGGQRPVRDLK